MTEKYEFENPNPHQYVFLQFVRVMGFKFNCSSLVLSSVVCGKHQEERDTTEKCDRTCPLKRMNDNVKCCRKRNTNRKRHEWWNDVNIICSFSSQAVNLCSIILKRVGLAEKERQKGREMEEKCVGLAEKGRHKAREMEELYVKIEIRILGVL